MIWWGIGYGLGIAVIYVLTVAAYARNRREPNFGVAFTIALFWPVALVFVVLTEIGEEIGRRSATRTEKQGTDQ